MKNSISDAFKDIQTLSDNFVTDEETTDNNIDMSGNSEIDIEWEKYSKGLEKGSIKKCYLIRFTKKIIEDKEFKNHIVDVIVDEVYGKDKNIDTETKYKKIKKQYVFSTNRLFAENVYKMHGTRFMEYNFDNYVEDYEEFLNNHYKKFKREYDLKLKEKYLKELKKQYNTIKKDENDY